MTTDLLRDWVEIFKAGEHMSSSGDTKSWSVNDLDEIINNYDPRKSEAPIVIGHPKMNEPAYGWVEKLKRVGTVLLAKFKQVDPDFAEKVRTGRYKKRSVSLRGNRLNHVGFLGAVHPAVEGLADLSLGENSLVFEFAMEGFEEEVMDNSLDHPGLDYDLFNYC